MKAFCLSWLVREKKKKEQRGYAMCYRTIQNPKKKWCLPYTPPGQERYMPTRWLKHNCCCCCCNSYHDNDDGIRMEAGRGAKEEEKDSNPFFLERLKVVTRTTAEASRCSTWFHWIFNSFHWLRAWLLLQLLERKRTRWLGFFCCCYCLCAQ